MNSIWGEHLNTLPLRKMGLFVPVLLSLLLITTSVASLNSPTNITSFGTIKYGGGFLFEVGFEIDDDFTYGTEHTGEYNSPWDIGGWGFTNPNVHIDPDYTIVHGGTRSCKMSLDDPSSVDRSVGYRLNLLHCWDPWVEHIWLEAWYYFPEDFPPPSSTNPKCKFFVAQSERCWTGPRQGGTYYFFNGPGIGFMIDSRPARPTYQQYLINLGRGRSGGPSLPDGGGAAGDVPLSDQQTHWTADGYVWDVPPEDRFLPVFGEWFKIKAHVWRNHEAWQAGDKDSGRIEVWLTLPPKYEERLAHNSTCRTIGIDPALIEEKDWYCDENGYAYVATGISCYPVKTSPPMHIYVDDVSLRAY